MVPIVASHGHPVEAGLAASLARPGGNLTGIAGTAGVEQLAAKRLEILSQIKPKPSRVAVLAAWSGAASPVRAELDRAARALGLAIDYVSVIGDGDIESTLAALRPNAMIVLRATGPVYLRRRQLIEWAVQHRVATLFPLSVNVQEGALMSYSPDYAAVFRRLATYVDKVLKGANPSDIPIEQPTKLELVVNLKTAKALGVTIPPPLLLRADHVIE
ncbi:MAG: ABC transporter substrate-binding protein [Candidatus Rokubacteria bacterium]|nr:ABC transporter substrate-binding protein [Candidatus Rokubacteria bacterium]